MSIGRTTTQLRRRYRQLRRLLLTEGLRGVGSRVRRAAAERLTPHDSVLPVRRSDVLAADLTRPHRPVALPVSEGERLVGNWVTTPPSPGSGGHTTLFRIIRYLEQHGYDNHVYFYDVYGADLTYYTSIVRSYYNFYGPVSNVEDGMEDAHLVVATGWPTAYAVFNSRCAGKRFYFIQDYEPHFYPVGSMSILAENTYRMGLHGISIGHCFAQKLRSDFGMTIETFRYGCDVSKYHRMEGCKRSGIVFYARRETARRGFELGLMALEIFASRRPDLEIHIYGDKIGKLPFAFFDHGRLAPDQINHLYNRCYAGLSLSFTNVSLTALEMLATGCIPVANDSPLVHTDMNNAFVRYADASPQALASMLESVVDTEEFDALSHLASMSVLGVSWDEAGAAVDSILRRALPQMELAPAVQR